MTNCKISSSGIFRGMWIYTTIIMRRWSGWESTTAAPGPDARAVRSNPCSPMDALVGRAASAKRSMANLAGPTQEVTAEPRFVP